MGLPWFAFTIKDFIANTTRLNTEAKGAYLMLMLDYYERESPPPDDDEVLATITGLPLERWVKHRQVIMPLFDTETIPGHLYHERIVAEIVKGHARYARSQAGLTAAREAVKAAAKRRRGEDESATVAPKTKPPKPIPAVSPVTEPVTEPVVAQSQGTHEHKHSIEVVSNDTTTRAPEVASQDAPLPSDFALTGSQIIGYQTEGYSSSDISAEFDTFRRYQIKAGTFSNDWPGMWDRWWERKKPSLGPKAKPRIEVTRKVTKAIPPEWTPKEDHHEIAKGLGLNVFDVESIFRDYCASSGKKYLDHDAAFRNFLRNQNSFTRGPTNGKAPGPDRSITGASQRLNDELDRRIAASEDDKPDGDDPV